MPINKLICFLLIALALTNCKKTLKVAGTPGEFSDSQVFANDSSTLNVVTGVYISMSGPGPLDGSNSMYLELGLAADELDEYYPDPNLLAIYTDAFSPAQTYFWNFYYTEIYPCNGVINSLPAAQMATASAIRRQAIGEAFFLRAFLLFYATGLYGDIPLPTTTDFRTNNVLTRTPQTAVYAQIISDLNTARGLLPSDYRDAKGNSTADRVRPNKWAAMALLARANLYAGNWADAQSTADSVIAANPQYSLLNDLTKVFLIKSPEAIWQIAPIYQDVSTYAASIFILDAAPNFEQTTALSPFLVNAFEPDDLRQKLWVGADTTDGIVYFYPYKYKANFSDSLPKEYLMVMRLGEQYLIRAEAKTRLGDLSGAAADLNQLRSRAGLPAVVATSQTQLLAAIAHERQVELFTEFGDRWLDLKRTNALNTVMPTVEPHKGGTWNSYDSLLPIPESEIQLNPHLTQNPGY